MGKEDLKENMWSCHKQWDTIFLEREKGEKWTSKPVWWANISRRVLKTKSEMMGTCNKSGQWQSGNETFWNYMTE